MSSDPEIIMLLREIRDLLADDRREQHDAQPAHRPAPHPIPEDGGRARQTPTDPWHSPDWDTWGNEALKHIQIEGAA